MVRPMSCSTPRPYDAARSSIRQRMAARLGHPAPADGGERMLLVVDLVGLVLVVRLCVQVLCMREAGGDGGVRQVVARRVACRGGRWGVVAAHLA